MKDFDKHFDDVTKMQRRMIPLMLLFGAIKLGIIGFVLWLAYRVVMHFIA